MTTQEPNETQKAELLRIKRMLPFRIAWGMFDKDTGEWSVSASFDRRAANKATRQGHTVFILA